MIRIAFIRYLHRCSISLVSSALKRHVYMFAHIHMIMLPPSLCSGQEGDRLISDTDEFVDLSASTLNDSRSRNMFGSGTDSQMDKIMKRTFFQRNLTRCYIVCTE